MGSTKFWPHTSTAATTAIPGEKGRPKGVHNKAVESFLYYLLNEFTIFAEPFI